MKRGFDSPEQRETFLRDRRQAWAADLRAQGVPLPGEFIETEEKFQALLAFISSKGEP